MYLGNRVEKENKGFTLAELMIAAVIFVLTFVGILLSYTRSMDISEMSRNSSTAVAAVKTRMEQIKNTSFSQVFSTYNNTMFQITGLTGIGVSYVDNTNPDLLEITISFCWQEKSGRIMGEDDNLNGQLDGGEDRNNNNLIDSPVQVISYIYNE